MKTIHFILFLQNLCFAASFIPASRRESCKVSNRNSPTCLRDALEPLAEEGTWQAYLDEDTTGLVYYFDTKTGESLWEPPTDTFPRVKLPRRKQRLADELRKKYRKARQMEAEAEEAKEETKLEAPSWIVGILDKEEEKVEEVEEVQAEVTKTTTQQQKDWFGRVFGDVVAEEGRVEEAVSSVFRGSGFLESFAGLASLEKAESVAAVAEEEETETEPVTPAPLKIEFGTYVLPHPAKVRWGGEDALFTKGRTFGVFDGVSGADKLDGVPLYSRTLAQEMKKMVGNEGLTVQQMTSYMNEAANFADSSATGASTAIVASIGENGFLQALNIGDSYCYVIRAGRITAKTREISHYWECPYQLSDDSPDRPKDGTKLNVELIAGDIVVMASDGIFDNISDDMLLDLIESSPPKPSQLAKKICDLSRKQSLDRNSVTPYAKQAQKRGDPDYKQGLGGKLDDASCIVVICK